LVGNLVPRLVLTLSVLERTQGDLRGLHDACGNPPTTVKVLTHEDDDECHSEASLVLSWPDKYLKILSNKSLFWSTAW